MSFHYDYVYVCSYISQLEQHELFKFTAYYIVQTVCQVILVSIAVDIYIYIYTSNIYRPPTKHALILMQDPENAHCWASGSDPTSYKYKNRNEGNRDGKSVKTSVTRNCL